MGSGKNFDFSYKKLIPFKNFFKIKIRKIFLKILPEINWHNFELNKIKEHPPTTYEVKLTKGYNVKTNEPFKLNEVIIGNYSYIAENSLVSQTVIGKFCSIGPNFLCGYGVHPLNGISTSPMFYSTGKQNGMTLSESDKIEERKTIYIGNDVFIGMNVTILDGITIGDGAVIGAGAVVSKNIPPYAIAVGNPIQIIRYRFSDEQIASLLKIKWWDFSED
ncbi:MAG: CatB-related O-acetyltransferase, partial [Bacteroidetes bacterium]|nr:CatB-related O-acetyltransferase [Bacteroidota bacterium]